METMCRIVCCVKRMYAKEVYRTWHQFEEASHSLRICTWRALRSQMRQKITRQTKHNKHTPLRKQPLACGHIASRTHTRRNASTIMGSPIVDNLSLLVMRAIRNTLPSKLSVSSQDEAHCKHVSARGFLTRAFLGAQPC